MINQDWYLSVLQILTFAINVRGVDRYNFSTEYV